MEKIYNFRRSLFNTKRISTTQDVVYCANRYDDNISLVKSEKSTHINRMKWQGEAYRHLMSKYKNNKLMPNLLYRIINKDVLEAKFYKKALLKHK